MRFLPQVHLTCHIQSNAFLVVITFVLIFEEVVIVGSKEVPLDPSPTDQISFRTSCRKYRVGTPVGGDQPLLRKILNPSLVIKIL